MTDQQQDPQQASDSERPTSGGPGSTPPPPIAGTAQTATEPATEIPKEVRNIGMLCHILALAGYVIPFGNIIGPLIIWLMKKEEHPFINEQGKEAINFQITVILAVIVCAVLFFLIVPLLLIPLIGIADLILIIVAAIKASAGEHFRYPVALRLVK